MTVEKTAQIYNVDGDITDSDDSSYSYDFDVFIEDEENESLLAKDKDSEKKKDNEDKEDKRDRDHEHHHDDGELVVLEFDDPEDTISFVVPDLPGALDISDIPDPDSGDDVVVEEEEQIDLDPWDWKAAGGHSNFLNWLQGMVDSTPKHSGHDVAGLERAMAYIELLLREISKAMRTDFKGEIDVNYCETMSDGMYRALDAMDNRKIQVQRFKHPNRFKGKKASWVESSGMVKEAQKITGVNGVTLVVPLFISRLARVLINGTVSAGHSMEDMYDDLKEEYELTKREEAELQQLLHDMGYPMFQDRGMLNQQVDRSRSNNKDWNGNFNG